VTAYVVRRLLYVVPLVLGVSVIVFLVFDSGMLGDPVARMLGKHATPEKIAEYRHALGYDDSFFTRLGRFLSAIARFDFERSSEYKLPVTEIIARGIWPSLAITAPAFLLATLVAVAMSLVCAAWRGRFVDRATLVVAVGLMSVSSLVYIIFAQYFLAYRMRLFPVMGYEYGAGAARFVALPVLIFVVLTIGPDLRYYRTAMLEEIKQDYVRTARAKGVSERKVLFVHVLRNGMIPVLTRVVVELPFLFVGSILLERFFGIPGLGAITVESVVANDVPVVRAMTFIFAVLLIVANLFTDIAYTMVDPRVRLA
jgi:peptide/nickel transport system permease protein